MARGRFISSTLGESDKFASLEKDTYRVMFILMVTNADAEGRLKADSRWLKGKVYTLLDYTPELIEEGLFALAQVKLIRFYEVDGERFAEIVKFHDHNKIRRNEDGRPTREGVSRIPAPDEGRALTAAVLPQSSSETAAKGLRVKGKEQRVKSKEQTSDSSPAPAGDVAQARRASPEDFLDAYNANRGPLPAALNLTDKRKRMVKRLVKEHGDESLPLLIEATKCVAADEYWAQQRYGFDNLLVDGRVLEKAEKFRTPRPTQTDRKPWNYSGGDAANRSHPEYRPVRGQSSDQRAREAERLANERKNELTDQAATALGLN
jgi:hypothetical protein